MTFLAPYTVLNGCWFQGLFCSTASYTQIHWATKLMHTLSQPNTLLMWRENELFVQRHMLLCHLAIVCLPHISSFSQGRWSLSTVAIRQDSVVIMYFMVPKYYSLCVSSITSIHHYRFHASGYQKRDWLEAADGTVGSAPRSVFTQRPLYWLRLSWFSSATRDISLLNLNSITI
jgi:hypothetical protein